MDTPGVYIILSTFDSRAYVGSSVRIQSRMRGHKNDLLKKKHGNPRLQNFVNKYGIGCLSFTALELCSCDELIKREQYYIDTLRPTFNISPTAGSILGIKRSRKYIEDMRRRLRGVKRSPESVAKQAATMTGRKLSEEHKRKIGLGNKGNERPDLIMANQRRRGIHLSDETKKKLSIAGKVQKRPHLLRFNKQRRILGLREKHSYVGRKINNLTVIKPVWKGNRTQLRCQCICGKICMVSCHRFITGGQKSCGCMFNYRGYNFHKNRKENYARDH